MARDADASARPKSHSELLRPTSALARRMAADLTNNDPRFRSLNVLSFDLDMPERTTTDYEQDVNPNVRAALTAALKDDEQLELEAEENLPTMGVGGNGWTPEGGIGGARAGVSAAAAAAKLAGRAGVGLGGGERSRRKKPSRSTDNDDIDALLGGGCKSSGAAEEQFPSSRGLVGGGRRPGMR